MQKKYLIFEEANVANANSFVHLSPVVWVYSQNLMPKKKALMNNCAIAVSSCDEAILSICQYTCVGKAFCCFSMGL